MNQQLRPTIGFIGLGTMGRPMARNLSKAGFPLIVFARRDEVAAEFEPLGARRAKTIRELTAAADVVISIVTDDRQLGDVVLSPAGVRDGAAAGKLLVDMSTVSPDTVRKLADELRPKGMSVVDAPVSGGPWGAESATLAIMAGGANEDFERCRPIFDALGKHIFHVGPLGSGQVAKLVNQMIAGGIMTLVGEGLAVAKVAGLDLAQLADVINVSSGNSAVFGARGKKFILADNYQPGFTMALMRKDVALAVGLATDLKVPAPVAGESLAQYDAAIAAGHGEADFAAVVKVAEKAAGIKLVGG
jgi:3-hydroxyisobutyrate dehydrogenase-like beta-hydroxyacid dehydrogenase